MNWQLIQNHKNDKLPITMSLTGYQLIWFFHQMVMNDYYLEDLLFREILSKLVRFMVFMVTYLDR